MAMIFSQSKMSLQKMAHLLFEVASDCGYVDPRKVEQILDLSRKETDLSGSSLTSAIRDGVSRKRSRVVQTVEGNSCQRYNISRIMLPLPGKCA